MEDAHTTEGKITATSKFPTTETTSSKLPTVCITGRISKLGQHLHILQTTHLHSDPTIKGRTFFQWHVTLQQKHQEKHCTLLRESSQLAHQKCHNQGCKGHQEKSQPVHLNTKQSTGNIGTFHLNIKHHQICNTSQQTTYQCSDVSSSEDTQLCHHTF